jgi:hypothetical protein
MNTSTDNSRSTGSWTPVPAASRVFADPVAYLASLGIESELIEVQGLPTAA